MFIIKQNQAEKRKSQIAKAYEWFSTSKPKQKESPLSQHQQSTQINQSPSFDINNSMGSNSNNPLGFTVVEENKND